MYRSALIFAVGFVGMVLCANDVKEKEMFRNADKNHDGTISQKEMEKMLHRTMGDLALDVEKKQRLLHYLSKGQDEIDNYTEKTFAKFDTNKDGQLDAKELEGMMNDEKLRGETARAVAENVLKQAVRQRSITRAKCLNPEQEEL